MKLTKVRGIVLSILLSTLLLVAVGPAWGLTKLEVLMNVETGATGMPEDAIADLQGQIDAGGLSPEDLAAAPLRIEVIQYLADKMAEAGYTFELQDWGWAEQLIQKQTASFVSCKLHKLHLQVYGNL